MGPGAGAQATSPTRDTLVDARVALLMQQGWADVLRVAHACTRSRGGAGAAAFRWTETLTPLMAAGGGASVIGDRTHGARVHLRPTRSGDGA